MTVWLPTRSISTASWELENPSRAAGAPAPRPAAGQASKVNLAFASCQNFEQAYYGSWARMLAEDRAAAEDERIHFVLHLGDFIYEHCW